MMHRRWFVTPCGNKPRSVDLWPIFHTGVPNLKALPAGHRPKPGNPLAAGKPFINNFLPMRRYAAPEHGRTRYQTQRSEVQLPGTGQAAVLGLTDSAYNGNSNLDLSPIWMDSPTAGGWKTMLPASNCRRVGGVVLQPLALYDRLQRQRQSCNTATGECLTIIPV